MKKTASGIGYTYMIFEVGTNTKYKNIMSAIFTFTLHTKSVNLLYYLCAFYNIYPQCEILTFFDQSRISACDFQWRNWNKYSSMSKKFYLILFKIFFKLTINLFLFSIFKVLLKSVWNNLHKITTDMIQFSILILKIRL